MAFTPPSISILGNDVNTSGMSLIERLFNIVIPLLLLFAGVIAVFYIIWAGWQYLTAGGDTERTKKARDGIVSGVIGIIIIMLTYMIIRLTLVITRETLSIDLNPIHYSGHVV